MIQRLFSFLPRLSVNWASTFLTIDRGRSQTSAGINGNSSAEPFRQAQDPESIEGL
jgi:hypothetical protein